MQSYLSGRGTSIENVVSVDGSNSFSPYLSDPSKQHDNMPKSEVIQNDVNSDTEVVHEDESGIKIEVVSVEGVNGPSIKVGSMTEVNTSGNWPKLYDTAKEQ